MKWFDLPPAYNFAVIRRHYRKRGICSIVPEASNIARVTDDSGRMHLVPHQSLHQLLDGLDSIARGQSWDSAFNAQ